MFIHFLSDMKANKPVFAKFLVLVCGLLACFLGLWTQALIRISKMKTFWIPPPDADFFVHYFQEYRGEEPYLYMAFAFLLIAFCLKEPRVQSYFDSKLLLFSWVFIVLFIPYCRSFDHPAPLHPRYTIVILPAIFLMAGSGLEALKGTGFRYFLFFTFLVMFGVNVFYSKGGYYQAIAKDQFREIAQAVLQENADTQYPLVASELIGCPDCAPFNTAKCYEYYFCKIFKQEIRFDASILSIDDAKEYVEKIKNRKVKGFWVLDGHVFMRKNIVNYFKEVSELEKEITFYRASARLFRVP